MLYIVGFLLSLSVCLLVEMPSAIAKAIRKQATGPRARPFACGDEIEILRCNGTISSLSFPLYLPLVILSLPSTVVIPPAYHSSISSAGLDARAIMENSRFPSAAFTYLLIPISSAISPKQSSSSLKTPRSIGPFQEPSSSYK